MDTNDIIQALAAGAGVVGTGAAGAAGRDGYEKLKRRLKLLLAGRHDADRLLDSPGERPEELRAALLASGAANDPGVREAVQQVLASPTVHTMTTTGNGVTAGSIFNSVIYNGPSGAPHPPASPAAGQGHPLPVPGR
jgi:hypothetical protein